jgi:8-oxo-dGTP diphosphatase
MVNVVCAIIKKGNKILVTQRSEKMKLPLKWEFPGGKLEKGEDEVNCIKRELKEELNIEIKVLEKLTNSVFDYGDIQINLIPYIVEYVSGEITLLEHAEFRWIESNLFLGLDWADADLPIVKELINR